MLDQTYIIAVSGGVDSMALLHKLMAKKRPEVSYVAAHFDHGIRADSHKDAALVKKTANTYGLRYEEAQGKLGSNASEALAREKRYEFLRQVAKKHGAEKIITGHHQDDVLETMIINLLRGTGPRGLMPMLKPSDILRPLLNSTKQSLIDYAKKHDVQWREDSTNKDENYLRNYVRQQLLPKLEQHTEQLLAMRRRIGDIYYEADQLLALGIPKKNVVYRTDFVRHSFSVQRELMRAWLLGQLGGDFCEIDKELIERCTIAVKTLPIGKKIDVGSAHWLQSGKQSLQIIQKD